MRKITRKSGSVFIPDRQGSVAVLVALGMTMLVGLTGLALDVGSYYMLQIRLQNSADAAALASAPLLGGDETVIRDRAKAYAELNMAPAAHGNTLVDGDITMGNWQNNAFTAGGAPENALRVTTRRAQVNGNAAEFYFLGLFGVASVNIVSEAIATKEEFPFCMISLSDSADGALAVSSNAAIVANGCAVKVNSDSTSAVTTSSNSSITADEVCIVGDASGDGTISPEPSTGCSKAYDPLAGLVLPLTITGCDEYSYSMLNAGNVTLVPCNYHDGLTLGTNTIGWLDPGLYVIDGGVLDIKSNAILNGTEITFYLTNGATFNFHSNTTINISAPTTGPLAGILIYQDPADDPAGTSSFDANTVGMLEGLIYLPNATLSVKSNADVGDTADYLMIMAGTIDIDSNGSIILNSDYSKLGGSPLSEFFSVARLRR